MPKRKPKVEAAAAPSLHMEQATASEVTKITSTLRKRNSDQTRRVSKDFQLKDELRKSRVWSTVEKEKFLKALKKYGFGGLEHVAKEVGTRSFSETVHFCEIRKKLLAKTRENSVQKSSNLNKWKEKISDTLDIRLKAPPYVKQSLAEVMDSAKVECQKLGLPTRSSEEEVELHNDLPDFSSIYDYFKSLVLQQIPTPLGPSESLITLNLMNDLLDILKTNKLDQEKAFLSCLPKRPRIAPKPEESLSGNKIGGEIKAEVNENNNCTEKDHENDDNLKEKEPENDNGFVSDGMEYDGIGAGATETINQTDDNSNKPSTSENGNEINEVSQGTNLKKTAILNQLAIKYPKLDLIEHFHRYLIAELNPLQIPLDLIKAETTLVNTHLTKREKEQK